MYAGSNVLFRSPDLGQSWAEISPDLTWAIDRDTLELMHMKGSEPQMSRNDGQASYGNLTALAESPLDPGVIYTGSDDGRVHVTRDGGVSWTDVTGNLKGLPSYTYVTRIAASRGEAGGVYAVFDGHRNDDFSPYIFRSDDFGESWESIVNGLPRTSLNAFAEHPAAHNLLFAGSEVGVHVSIDGGASWRRLGNGLPTVPVDDMVVHARENDLVIGTHGLGIWIMDDIAPLEELTGDMQVSAVHLYPVRRATSFNPYRPQGWTPGIFAAPNPPGGARIRYRLGSAGDSVTIRITDPAGVVVRKLAGSANEGLNEITWDLRLVEEDASGKPLNPGPRVLPGTYIVTLAMGEETKSRTLEVRLDPRAEISQADLPARQEAMLDSYRMSGAVSGARELIESMRGHLNGIEDRIDEAAEPPADLREEVDTLRAALEEAGGDLDDAGRGASVWRVIQRATNPPTADQLWTIDRSWKQLPAVIERVNFLLAERMPLLFARAFPEDLEPGLGEAVAVPVRRR